MEILVLPLIELISAAAITYFRHRPEKLAAALAPRKKLTLSLP